MPSTSAAPGLGDIINSNGMLRSMEQTLVDLITDDPAGLLLANRRIDIQLEITRRTLEAARGGIDFLWMGEDLGTQIGPMISLELYPPAHPPAPPAVRRPGQGLQPPGHDPHLRLEQLGLRGLHRDGHRRGRHAAAGGEEHGAGVPEEAFGGRLAFHGCISTAGPVAFGTSHEVDADCRRTLEIMMPGGGYCFAPTHQLQDNSPTENVLAMYEAARKYGRFA